MANDLHFLSHAIRIGARGLGRTWPNPSVGCVLVRDGRVLATATTGDGGRPHAETIALASAGVAAREATAYVSLEPCAHHGVTPPCAEALIAADVARVVIAAMDPDSRVAGRGVAMLEAAGIAVEKNLLPAAADSHRGFFRRVQHGVPYVALKLATSLDGKIADVQGASRWITCEAAHFHHVHRLRAQFDAIVTGSGTVLADDPLFTVRLPGLLHAHAVRVVCDRSLRLPLTSALVKSANAQPVWLLTTAEGVERGASHATELREAGVVLHVVEDEALAPLTILKTLGAAGLTRVLVEAGTGLSTAFLAARCVDTLYWYRAPMLLGNAGKPAIAALDTSLETAARATSTHSVSLGDDRCDMYELASCLLD